MRHGRMISAHTHHHHHRQKMIVGTSLVPSDVPPHGLPLQRLVPILLIVVRHRGRYGSAERIFRIIPKMPTYLRGLLWFLFLFCAFNRLYVLASHERQK